MDYPLLPTEAATQAWQLICCVVTLIVAMFTWLMNLR